MNTMTMTVSYGISYWMVSKPKPAYPAVCVMYALLTLSLTERIALPATTLSSTVQYKTRVHSSSIFTGRREYLRKLGDFFSAQPNESSRRKCFLLYGMGGIGKTQICLKFTEESSDL
jgi:hypothetical protein